MEKKKRGSQFLSGFGNENIIEEYYVKNNQKLKPGTILSESNDEYKIELGIPYMRKEDIDIAYETNKLIISAKRPVSEEHEENSRNYKGIFEIPDDVQVEKIQAVFNNGLLAVILPKKNIRTKIQKSFIR